VIGASGCLRSQQQCLDALYVCYRNRAGSLCSQVARSRMAFVMMCGHTIPGIGPGNGSQSREPDLSAGMGCVELHMGLSVAGL
jgi:hypothetical protein